ncbi:MAG: hypothetical protein FWD66_04725 [Paludibacter sp.]|nr:hypothetical protein [Paludibacter sp.]
MKCNYTKVQKYLTNAKISIAETICILTFYKYIPKAAISAAFSCICRSPSSMQKFLIILFLLRFFQNK